MAGQATHQECSEDLCSVGISTLELCPDLIESLLRDCLASFPHVRLKVTGCCMEPAFSDGDVVLLANPARRPPRIGDVVLVRQPVGLRLHRLIWGPPLASRLRSWRSQADRAAVWDPRFASGDIIGTVITIAGDQRNGQPANIGTALRSLVRGMWTRFRLACSKRR